MRLLILGGTVFLGRHLAECALARGHSVTLFNRGRSNPDLFADREGVTLLRGDRDGGLPALGRGRWDAVIDTSGYLPRIVGAAAAYLAARVEHYTFISSISVYANFHPPGPHEGSPLAVLADERTETVDGETYGGLKALCERAVESALPGRSLVLRPGLIVGPDDPTDRFSYWPLRAARGGEMLAPGRPGAPVQVIDVRDLCDWTLSLVEARAVGVYNVTGPSETITLGELLETCRASSDAESRLIWVEEPFLVEQGVTPFSELPCWVPTAAEGIHQAGIARALEAGLHCRPLAETVADTLAWRRPLLEARPLRAGLDPERESELLAAWRTRSGVI